MTRDLIVVGCGGFGREVLSIVRALSLRGHDWRVMGFVDDQPSDDNVRLVRDLRSTVLGPVNALAELAPIHAVVAIGSPSVRATIVERLAGSQVSWATVVHPDASIGLEVELGEGTVVAAGARLSTNILCGSHVHIDQNVVIGHDVSIGDYTRINPAACISGSALVGQQTLIGANATILQGLSVGSRAVVGAGAVVVDEVSAGSTVKGVPAR